MLINKGFKQFISFSLSLIMLFSIYLPALSEVNITQYSVNIMGQTFGNLDELYVKATKYVNNKQPDEALVYLQEILKYAPNDHSVYFTMGACYILKKDYQQAIPYLLKAYQLNPIELLYAYSIGNAYFEIKNYNEAIIYLKRATASFNSDTKRNARRYLAEAYYMTKDYTNSEKVFQKLSKGHPDSLYYKKMIACCKFFNKEHNESTILFEDILTKNNQDADVHYYLAANYLIKSELNKAAMHLNTAKKINPAYQKEADSLLAQYTPDKVSLQQPSKQKTLTQQNIISSTPLYTAAIVPANEEALKLAQKHANITKDIVKNIEVLTTKLLLAKQLNEEFMQLTSDQLVKWKNFSDANSSLELLYNKEIDNFNYVFKYQAQEELKWAVIISLLEEIEKLNAQDKTAINKSSAKSFLYSSLLILEIDLVDFYKDKYSNVFYNVAVNHAFQESPNLEIKVPEKVKEQIIPLHEKELAYIELLFINIAAVLETSETLEDKTIEITDLFNDINQYTSNQIKDMLISLDKSIYDIEIMSSVTTSERVSKDYLPVLKSYKTYYTELKNNIDQNVSQYDKQKTLYIEVKNQNPVKLACVDITYETLLYSGYFDYIHGKAKSFISTSAGVVSRTVKTIATGTASAADYITAKTSNNLFSGIDHAQNMWKYGYNSKEYETWKNEYNKQTEKAGGPTILNTFLVPTLRTVMTGKSEESYDRMLSGIGETMETGYKGVKTTATMTTSNVNYFSSKAADFIYGTDSTESYDDVVLKPTEEAFYTDKTDISLDRAKAPVGLAFAIGNLTFNALEPKKAEEILVKDIITPLKDWYGGGESNVGQTSIQQANKTITNIEKGTADFLGVDTSVSCALLNIATGGMKDFAHGFIKLSDKSVSEQEKVGALFDMCGGLEDLGVDNYLNNSIRKPFLETVEKTTATLKDTLKKYSNDIPNAKKEIAKAQERVNLAVAAGKSLDEVQGLMKEVIEEESKLARVLSGVDKQIGKNVDNAKSELFKNNGVGEVIKDASSNIPQQTLKNIEEIASKSNFDKVREYIKTKFYDVPEAQKSMVEAKNEFLLAKHNKEGLDVVQKLQDKYIEKTNNYNKIFEDADNAVLDITVTVPDKVIKLAQDSTANQVKNELFTDNTQVATNFPVEKNIISSQTQQNQQKLEPYSVDSTNQAKYEPYSVTQANQQKIQPVINAQQNQIATIKPPPVKNQQKLDTQSKTYTNTGVSPYYQKQTTGTVVTNQTPKAVVANHVPENLIPPDIIRLAMQNSIKSSSTPGAALAKYVNGVPENILNQAVINAGSYDVKAINRALATLMIKYGIPFNKISILEPPVVQPTQKPVVITKPVKNQAPIQVPTICNQSTYNWIPKRVCLEAWINSGKNIALFHREVGRLITKYNIKRP